MARDAAERAQRRREEAAEREAASEQQWEYRVTARSADGGLELAGLQAYPIAEDALGEAARLKVMPGWSLLVERRPVGDWQPYDPEADR